MGQNDVGRERDQLLRVFAGIGGIAPAPATGSRGCTATAKPNVDGSTPVISSEGLALIGGGARA